MTDIFTQNQEKTTGQELEELSSSNQAILNIYKREKIKCAAMDAQYIFLCLYLPIAFPMPLHAYKLVVRPKQNTFRHGAFCQLQAAEFHLQSNKNQMYNIPFIVEWKQSMQLKRSCAITKP